MIKDSVDMIFTGGDWELEYRDGMHFLDNAYGPQLCFSFGEAFKMLILCVILFFFCNFLLSLNLWIDVD